MIRVGAVDSSMILSSMLGVREYCDLAEPPELSESDRETHTEGDRLSPRESRFCCRRWARVESRMFQSMGGRAREARGWLIFAESMYVLLVLVG